MPNVTRRRGTRRAHPGAPSTRAVRALVAALALVVSGLVLRPAPAPDPDTHPTASPAGRAPSAAGHEVPTTSGVPSRGSDSTAPPSTTAAPQPRSFSVVATGDILLHQPLWDQAFADGAAGGRGGHDFAPLMAGKADLVGGADLAICHLETPLAPRGGPYYGYPSFSAPPEIAEGLAATGYDACTTASNHTYDQGADGVDRTLDELDAAGLAHAGSARTPEEAQAITLLEVEDVKVALLAYTYGFNGIPAPGGETWRSNLIDEATILADAAQATDHGADVVIVALHWGDEYSHEPNGQQQDLAPVLIGSPDIDLLLGHHAHVVQPVEALPEGWVVYGMGNSVANQATLGPEKAEGLLVRFTFTEQAGGWEVTRAEFTVTLLDRVSMPRRLVVVPDALASEAIDEGWRQRLEEAWTRTSEVVHRRGAEEAGLTPIPGR